MKTIDKYPLIKKEVEQCKNIKSYSVNSYLENYIFPKEENNKSTTIINSYEMSVWKQLIDKLNWNY